MHLTTEERILLHLHRYCGRKSEWEAPYELSQAGISASLHLPQSSVSRSLAGLEEKKLIEERVLYIRGEERKKKAYFPSAFGMEEAKRLYAETDMCTVNVADMGAISIKELREYLLKEKGLDIHPLQIYSEFAETGIVNITDIDKKSGHLIFQVPERRAEIYGRKKETDIIKERIKTSKVLIIKGMAGMGKTTILTEAAYELSKSMNVFWYRFRDGRGLANLKRELNDFLRISSKKPLEKDKGAENFHNILKDTNSALIFDDLHMADKESLEFISELSEKIIAETSRTKILTSSREEIPIVKKAHIAKGLVFELYLGPLEREELTSIIPEEELERAYDSTGGIPLFIELYRNTVFIPSEARDILNEEVLYSLSKEEKRALKALSVHRVPVYPEAMGVSPAIADGLRKKLLIFESEDGKIDSHDLIKEAVYGGMDSVERMKYHRKAAEYYLSPWNQEDKFEAVHHLQACKRWLEAGKEALRIASEYPVSSDIKDILIKFRDKIAVLPEKMRTDILLLTGDILGLAGNWEDALEYYAMAEKIAGKIADVEERIAKASAEIHDWKTGIEIEERLLKKARKKGDKNSTVRHLISIGNIRMKKGDLKNAVERYKEAEKLLLSTRKTTAMSVIYNNMGTAYLRMGRNKEAKEMLEKAVKLSKLKSNTGIRAAENLAYLLEEEGDYEASILAYKSVMAAGNGSYPVIEHLINLLIKLGRYDEAFSLLEKEAKDERILNLIADVYRASGRTEEAVKYRKMSISMEKSIKKMISLIEDLLACGKAFEALKMAEKIEKELLLWDYEKRVKLKILKGDAFLLSADTDKARDSYIRALEISEENMPELSYLIEKRLERLHKAS